MKLVLERRPERSKLMAIGSPLVAILLTLVTGAALFAALGHAPLRALYVFFLGPWTQAWSIQELLVKAAPLVLIAVGLSLCYLSENWNIGAEGQYIAGAIVGGGIALAVHGSGSQLSLPLVLLAGFAGGT